MNINLAAVPNIWQQKATPHIETLVKAFQETGITSPVVCAYACASIAYESSWNPRAENTRDSASWTAYSGKGLAQVTLESNYRKISQFTGINFLLNPDLMFVPYYSLRAKAAHFLIHGMIPLINVGNFEAAAGIYNAGNASYRSAYTRNIAHSALEWLPVFSTPSATNYRPEREYTAPRINTAPRYRPPRLNSPPRLTTPPVYNDLSRRYSPSRPPNYMEPPNYNQPPRYISETVAANSRAYIVQRGDSLLAIASQFGVTFRELLGHNPQISNPNKINVGDRVNIP
ncbi:MAG: LysM peptidoglycan-binding domain-containing protein [Methylococcaceae bacterium]|nr:LysM peptidoglycan-binding domain-containing protein [Methylococcaceae bacterium]